MQLSRCLPSTLRLFIAVLILVSTLSCARRRPVEPQAAPTATRPTGDPSPDRPTTPSNDARDSMDPTTNPAPTGDPRWSVVDARIYFDFDRSNLSAEARATLTAKLSVLLDNPEMRIRIIGHADERGSDEYNLALGMERAAAAKRFLTQRGVAPDRIEVASMGEEQPVCTVSAESCWWQNRRDEFVITTMARARRP